MLDRQLMNLRLVEFFSYTAYTTNKYSVCSIVLILSYAFVGEKCITTKAIIAKSVPNSFHFSCILIALQKYYTFADKLVEINKMKHYHFNASYA